MTNRLDTWAASHRSHALSLIRIFLGIGLFVRGLVFLTDSVAYAEVIGDADPVFGSMLVMHYVALAHLGGGLFLALGALTRVAAAIQVPVLVGAVLFVHLPDGVTSTPFAFAMLVLVLLTVFAVWGAGPLSLDWILDRTVAEDEASERQSTERHAQLVRARGRLRPRRGAEREPIPERAARASCACGHERGDGTVDALRTYSTLGRLRFATGTHPRPSSVEFRCRACGGAVEVATDAATLEAYRYGRAGA